MRRRAMLACLTSMLLGVGLTPLTVLTWHDIRAVQATTRSLRDQGLPGQAGHEQLQIYFDLAAYGLITGLVIASCYLLARAILRPMRSLTATLTQFGPNNLGQRTRLGGPHDELRHLADSLDDMLDRFTAGYEGQRLFAANASHELRTPLALQRALIEVSMSQPLTDEQLRLLCRQLLHANVRNERLIEGLLVLSESDRGLTATALIALDRLIGSIIDSHTALAAAADVTLDFRSEECIVRGERLFLERLTSNLIQNAIKYNRPGGRVDVSVTADRTLRVTNTGEPGPQESVAKLFEPFRRLDADRTTHIEGAGLGLTIARSITQAHGGTISAWANNGGGLALAVTFPEP